MSVVLGTMIAGGLLGAAGGIGTSPQQKQAEKLIGTLEESEAYLKSTPFSKEEIMNDLLPEVQKMYRAASDVAAGKIGASIGESDLAPGQGFADYYAQTLAPVIAQGEQQAAAATSKFGKWYSALDAQAKQRFLESVDLQMQATQGLPSMNQFQRMTSGALSGMNLGATAGGNIAKAGALNTQADLNKNLNELLNTQGALGGQSAQGILGQSPNAAYANKLLLQGMFEPANSAPEGYQYTPVKDPKDISRYEGVLGGEWIQGTSEQSGNTAYANRFIWSR